MGLFEYVRFGLPATVMRCMEYWAIEFVSIMTGWIGTQEQAAFIICFHCTSVAYRIPYGISNASVNPIGTLLGAGQYKNAKKYALAALMLTIVDIILNIIVFAAFSRQIIGVFTTHEEFVDIGSKLLMMS